MHFPAVESALFAVADTSQDVLPPHRRVLGVRVDATNYLDATARILKWAEERRGRYVCFANVHMTMECHDSPALQQAVNEADLVTPDGMPLVWALTRMGVANQTRVYGPTLTLNVCEAAAREGVPVGFYGASEQVLQDLVSNLTKRFPGLDVAYAHSPPFRELTGAEADAICGRISESGARILFVGLGCPRQELWMASHRYRMSVVMLGVGAAFDFHAASVKQAPAWLQARGLEWLFRLTMEPRRLWRRYLVHNPRFVALMLLQLLGLRRFEHDVRRRKGAS